MVVNVFQLILVASIVDAHQDLVVNDVKIVNILYFKIIECFLILFSTGDPCSQNPCMNGGQCHPTNSGGFTCQCPVGFNGQRCEERQYMF